MNRNGSVFVNVGSSCHDQQQPVVPAVANSSTTSPKERYKNVLFKMGVAEIIAGTLSIILGVATLIIASSNRRFYHDFYYYLTYPGQGTWCGVFEIVVGIMGVRARSNPSQCMYNANMALSISGSNVMGALTILSALAAGLGNLYVPSLMVVHFILALLGFLGVILMIVHSAYCCAGVCCKYASYQRVAVSYHPGSIGMEQHQLIQLANGQYVLAPTHMTAPPYPMVQISVVGAPVAYHQPPHGITSSQMPANQSFHDASFEAQMTPAFLCMNSASSQTMTSTIQQIAVTNPRQGGQAKRQQEANDDPPEYSTLSGDE